MTYSVKFHYLRKLTNVVSRKSQKNTISELAVGFTLIEVIIAITILAAMSLAMFGASRQIMDAEDLTKSRDEKNHAITFALDRMSQDLSSAYVIKSKTLLGAKFDGALEFEGAEARLDFVSFSHLRYIQGAQETDSSELSYYLEQDPEDSDSYVLMRRQSTVLDKNRQEGGRAYPLLAGVRSLSFEYLPFRGDEWKKEWDTKNADTSGRLPRAVKIQLEVQIPDEENPKTYSVIAPVRLQQALSF